MNHVSLFQIGTLLLTTTAVLPLAANSQTVISSGHVDIGVLYEAGAWDLHVHQEEPEPGAEYAPDEAVFRLGSASQQPGGVPNTPAAIGYFGPAGSPLWVITKSEVEDVPFLGIGAEEMAAEDWNGPLTLAVTGVTGPGDVFVWDVGAFGELLGKVSTRDGIGAGDAFSVEAGSHAHYFWGFSAPGDYAVTVRASGTHAADGDLVSDPATYRFQVVPEPGALGLLGVGAAMLLLRGRKSASRFSISRSV
jgi:surface-anchored protein